MLSAIGISLILVSFLLTGNRLFPSQVLESIAILFFASHPGVTHGMGTRRLTCRHELLVFSHSRLNYLIINRISLPQVSGRKICHHSRLTSDHNVSHVPQKHFDLLVLLGSSRRESDWSFPFATPNGLLVIMYVIIPAANVVSQFSKK